jgi:hypothetical protein
MELHDSLAEHWRRSHRHRAAIEASARCGCFSCGHTFSPAQIEEWIDEPAQPARNLQPEQGCTAICPRFGLDAVLPGQPEAPSNQLLTQMNARYFTEIGDGIRLGPTGPG